MGPRFVHVNSYFWAKVEEGLRDDRRIADLYDAKVRYVDREIGRLLDHLEALGLTDDTLVVVTSDHGEGLTEHGLREHGGPPYQHQIRVPLILRGPGIEPGRVATAPAELIDLPLALGALTLGPNVDWADPAAGGNGALLRELGLDAPDEVDGSVVATVHLRETRQEVQGVILDDHKLMLDAARDRELVFDLAADPGERTDLAGDDGSRDGAMRAMLERRLGPPGDRIEAGELSPEVLERLRAMGYVP